MNKNFFNHLKLEVEYYHTAVDNNDRIIIENSMYRNNRRIKIYFSDQLTGGSFMGIKDFDAGEELYSAFFWKDLILQPISYYLIKPNRGFDINFSPDMFEMSEKQIAVVAEYIGVFTTMEQETKTYQIWNSSQKKLGIN